ncbi:uncharacterized protein VTP21DRAFT_8439 [Calcarisporiella thermophila]|uniref:uncharacterized protein n=1 Tax=Calcarisporiella thermophila TaxID=911321 RepID=UPI003742AE88
MSIVFIPFFPYFQDDLKLNNPYHGSTPLIFQCNMRIISRTNNNLLQSSMLHFTSLLFNIRDRMNERSNLIFSGTRMKVCTNQCTK